MPCSKPSLAWTPTSGAAEHRNNRSRESRREREPRRVARLVREKQAPAGSCGDGAGLDSRATLAQEQYLRGGAGELPSWLRQGSLPPPSGAFHGEGVIYSPRRLKGQDQPEKVERTGPAREG